MRQNQGKFREMQKRCLEPTKIKTSSRSSLKQVGMVHQLHRATIAEAPASTQATMEAIETRFNLKSTKPNQ